MRRFLQHVLPKGLHMVRYFGLWHASKRRTASKARLLLHMQSAKHILPQAARYCETSITPQPCGSAADLRICPRCQIGHLLVLRKLLPKQPQGP